MKKNIYIWGFTISLLLLLFSGCGGSPLWYKPDKNRVDFDLTSRECEFIAQQMATQSAVTGQGKDPVEYMKAYNRCMYARGWSQNQQVTKTMEPPPSLVVVEGHQLAAFGKSFFVPDEFQLLQEQKGALGPTTIHSFLFKGREELYLNIIFQQNERHAFEPVDYPVNSPFFLYHKGTEKPMAFKWSTFFGEFNNEWVTGLGAYRMIDKRQRIAFVLTTPLTKAKAPPPPGFKITRTQRDMIESFMETWLPRLKRL